MLKSAKNAVRAKVAALQARVTEAVGAALHAAALGLMPLPAPVPVRVRDRRSGRTG